MEATGPKTATSGGTDSTPGCGGGFRRIRVLLFFSVLFLFRLATVWDAQLVEPDGPRVAGIAREMAAGDAFIPHLNGEQFLEYPPLGYLPTVLALSLSRRPPDWLAVLPAAFLGTATAFFTFLLGRRLAGERVGLAAALILSTSIGFFMLHRRCLVDSTLLLCVTLSLWGFAAGWAEGGRQFRYSAAFYLGMAGGFLSKGALGAVLPGAVAATFLIARRDVSGLRRLRPLWGALLFALPILAWEGVAAWIDHVDPLWEVIRQSLSRFFSPTADHAGRSVLYYFPNAFVNFLPWILLLFALFLPGGRGWRRRLLSLPLGSLTLLWFVVGFVGLSVASAKRVLYLAPLYPAFALLAALFWDHAVRTHRALRRWEVPASLLVLLTLGILHFAYYLPFERAAAFGPFFEAVEREGRPVFLYHPDEAVRGAAFFYLGRQVPALWGGEDLQKALADRSEKLVIATLPRLEEGDRTIAGLPAGDFHLIHRRRLTATRWLAAYSNR